MERPDISLAVRYGERRRAGSMWCLGAAHGAVKWPNPVLGEVVLDLILGARGRPGQPIVKCSNGSRKHF